MGAVKEDRGVFHEILIQRPFKGHHNHYGVVVFSTGAAGLLPGGDHGTGETRYDNRVQATDVNTQLQSVGGGHSQQLPGFKTILYIPPLRGQVARPVGYDLTGQIRPGVLQFL